MENSKETNNLTITLDWNVLLDFNKNCAEPIASFNHNIGRPNGRKKVQLSIFSISYYVRHQRNNCQK